MPKFELSRRGFLTASAIGAASLSLTGCFDAAGAVGGPVRSTLEMANSLTYRIQRMLLGSDDLAVEYAESEIRQPQRANGTVSPQDEDYLALANANFGGYRLEVSGLVDRPLSLSLDEIRNMAARTQVTRHDCVEGWSCIAKWTGTPLTLVLDQAGVKANARYVMFECFDTMEESFTGPVKYYESIDLIDARHPQTILAYGLNGQTLPVQNGAPLRVRVERQLGYKMAKYIRAIRLTDTLAGVGGGRGGYWEDTGYDWFGGI